ncbi:unnamed protein product [Closterium sp. NIES-53]
MQLTKGAGRASVTPLSTGAPRFYTPYSGPSKAAARAPGAPRGEESESPPPGHVTHSPLASPTYPFRQLHARAVSPLAGPSRGQGPSTSANPFPELPFSCQHDSVRAHGTAAEDVDPLGQKGDSSHPFPPLLGALGESAEHEQFVTWEEFQALRSEMYAMFAQLGLRRGAPVSYAGGSAVVPMKGTTPPMSAVDKVRVLVLQETNPFPVCGGPNGNLTAIPDAIEDGLRHLRELILHHIPITHLPASFFRLSSLEKVDLKGLECLRGCLPEGFGSFTHLRELSLSSIPGFTSLPASLSRLGLTLTSLTIESCNELKALPTELGRLEMLEEVHLSHLDSLESIPRLLLKLPRLRELDVSSCKKLGRRSIVAALVGGTSNCIYSHHGM